MNHAEAQSPTPHTPLPTPLLRAADLHRHFQLGEQTLHVLRGVNLSVKPGEWVAILGSSGSGKSTLLHLLGGLDTPDAGTVQFEDRNVFAMTGRQLDAYRNRHVGFVFQFYHLLPELNALENVLIAGMIRSSWLAWPGKRTATRRRATDLLTRLGLEHRIRQHSNKLSGGERQRVAIARAMLNEPRILLLDEPTGNLDRRTGNEILEVFRELHRGGQTIVMVTHDATIAEAADRRLLLRDGQLQKA